MQNIDDFESSKYLPPPLESSSESSVISSPNSSFGFDEDKMNDLFPKDFEDDLQGQGILLSSITEAEKLKELSEILLKSSYSGKKEEMSQIYLRVFPEIKKRLKKYQGILAFSISVRLAMFCSFTDQEEEALKWCEKALKIKKDFTDELISNDEELQRNVIRFYNVYANVLLREKCSKKDLAKRVKKALVNLDKGKDLLENFDAANDKEKVRWKEQNKAWNLMSRGECYLKQGGDRKEAEKLLNEAFSIFQKGKNQRLSDLCLEKMELYSIKLLSQDPEVSSQPEDSALEPNKCKEQIENVIEEIENIDIGVEESCQHPPLKDFQTQIESSSPIPTNSSKTLTT